ncbi:MAG: trypsin-like serine protease [Pyrinomonadaceae bacterium]
MKKLKNQKLDSLACNIHTKERNIHIHQALFVIITLFCSLLLMISSAKAQLRITNAPMTSEAPWSVHMTGSGRSCSGIVLTETIVVTSAHCKLGTNITIRAVDASGNYIEVFKGSATRYQHPAYDPSKAGPLGIFPASSDSSDDIGFYKLSSELNPSISPAPIFADERKPWLLKYRNSTNSVVTVFAWGRGTPVGASKNCPSSPLTGGVKRISDSLKLSQPLLGAYPNFAQGRTYWPFGWISGKSSSQNLCPGDSGSPWILKRGNEYLVIAVSSTVESWPNRGVVNATLIGKKLPWIISASAAVGTYLTCPKLKNSQSGGFWYRQCTQTLFRDYRIQQLSSKRFVDAHEESTNDFNVVTRTKQNNDSQVWTFISVGNNRYRIRQKNTRRYLDAHEISSQDYRLVTRPRQNNNTQEWIVNHLGRGQFTLQQASNSRFVDAHEHRGEDYRVVTRPRQRNETQKWLLKPVE